MKRLDPTSPESHSGDIVAENVDRLKALFPEVFTEGRVDLDVLRDLLGDFVEESDEKYGLTWHGKRRARQLALTPSAGTLRPCPEESKDWENTQNLMIEGDNLEVLKLLQKSYAGKVKLIYIDPPYNTGSDLIYQDNYRDNMRNYLSLTKQVDLDERPLASNSEASGRFHTRWLNMMYPRLQLARNLLSREGLILVSIDDHEVANLRKLMDEIFGEENFLATFLWKKMDSPSRNDAKRTVSEYHDYIVAYTRSSAQAQLQQMPKPSIVDAYPITLHDGRRARRRQLRKNGKAARREDRPSMWYPLTAPDGTEVWPVAPPPEEWEGRWTLSLETWREREQAGETEWIRRDYGWVPYVLEFAPNNPRIPWPTWWDDLSQNRQAKAAFTGLMQGSGLTFDNPKPVDLIRRMLSISADPDALVLDFFAGSGSTGHAVWAQNAADDRERRFILVQVPNDSTEESLPLSQVTRERLRRAASRLREEYPNFAGDLGFRVFKLDSSNIRAWDPHPDDLDGTLLENVDHLKEDRSEQDVLYELLLKRGLDLAIPIESRTIADRRVHSIGAGTLLVCLDDEIDRERAEQLATGIVSWRDELDPAGDVTCVFRDSAFSDDVAKTNLSEILKQHAIQNVRSL